MEELEFSPWIKIEYLNNHEESKRPGVYLLAHYDQKPSKNQELDSQNIIYIGETTTQTIRKRLFQFANSAFLRKIGHSGGWTYSELFLDNEPIYNVPENLYVSFLPVDFPNPKECKAYIKYIERYLIWNFYKKNKNYPVCNRT